MSVLLIATGFIPYVLGGIMNRYMMSNPDTVPPFLLITIITLLIWIGVAFFAQPYAKSIKHILMYQNTIGLINLILLGIQELILKHYWLNTLGSWTQFYYLPLLNIGFTLSPWSHTVFTAYCMAFLLMIMASWIGCKLRR